MDRLKIFAMSLIFLLLAGVMTLTFIGTVSQESHLYPIETQIKVKRLLLPVIQSKDNLTDEEILKTREEIRVRAEETIGESVELIDSFIEDYPGEINKSVPVWYLGKSIQLLSQADIAYFGGDWRNARGCRIEHEVADKYGIKIIEE